MTGTLMARILQTVSMMIGVIASNPCIHSALADTSVSTSPPPPSQPSPPGDNISPLTDDYIKSTLKSLDTAVVEIRKKIDKPSKDFWDKMTAVSGLISGLAVALIGFYATNVYNRRQRISEERRKDQELLISQIQTVEKFMPHLSSLDENIKGGALIAISALGNEELAIKLATAFGGSGATAALTSIASTAGPENAASAGLALQTILGSLQECTVLIWNDTAKSVGSGIIISPVGLIITASYMIENEPDQLTVRFDDGTRTTAKLLKVDETKGIALLSATLDKKLPRWLILTSSNPLAGERVIGLLTENDGSHRVEIGEVIGLQSDRKLGIERIIISLNNVGRRSSGAPIVNSRGHFIGFIFSKDVGSVFLVSSKDVLSFSQEFIHSQSEPLSS